MVHGTVRVPLCQGYIEKCFSLFAMLSIDTGTRKGYNEYIETTQQRSDKMKLWTMTQPNTAAREAAVIMDAFNTAKTFGNAAPRDVEHLLRFAMTCELKHS